MTTAATMRLACAALALSLGVSAQVNRPDPQLAVDTWNGLPVVAGRLLVGYASSVDRASQLQLETALGVERVSDLADDLALVQLAPSRMLVPTLAALGGRQEVTFAEPDVLMQPGGITSDPKWSQQWSLTTVDAPAAFELAQGSPEIVIAVIDSGVRADHVDLAADYAWGLDTYAGDANPEDSDGHGTHCSGVAAADTDNGVGVAGAGFRCRFAAYRCGNSSFPTSALVAAIDDAVAQGAQVLSMSWGSSYNSYSIRSALQDAADAGCLLVAAAGNDGTTSSFYPAALSFVLAVGSSTPSDTRSSFSNHGSWVSVAAPGQGILSTYKNGGYASLSGTSMACPLVAGLGGLLYAQLGATRSAASAAAVRAAIEDSAVPVGSWVAHGRVDFPAALTALASAPPSVTQLEPEQSSPQPGQLLTLRGSGLLGADSVLVDGQAADGLLVVDDTTLRYELPALAQLGALPVTVVEGGQQSAPLTLLVAPPDPPELSQPGTLDAGGLLELGFAGAIGQQALLLVAADASTFVLHGRSLLLNHVPLGLGALDEQGLGALAAQLPPSIQDVTVYLQLVTVAGGLSGASGIGTLVIGS